VPNILEIVTRGRNETRSMWDEVRDGAAAVKRGMKDVGDEVDKSGKSWDLERRQRRQVGGRLRHRSGRDGRAAEGVRPRRRLRRRLDSRVRGSREGADPANSRAEESGQRDAGVLDQYARLGKAIQATTEFTDDMVSESQKTLTQFGVYPSKMEPAIRASADLAAGLGIDLKQATQLVGKAFAGETGTLSRFGVIVDDVALKTRGADAVLEAIQRQFGGAAAANLEAYSGKVTQIGNAWADVKESVGGMLIQDPLVQRFLTGQLNSIKLLTGATEDQGVATRGMATAASEFAGGAGTSQLLRVLRFWADNANEVVKAQRAIANLPPPSLELPRVANTTADALARVNTVLDEEEKRQKAAAEASKKHDAELAAIHETLTGKGAIASMQEWVSQVDDLGGVTHLSKDAQEAYNKQLESGIGYLNAAGKAVPKQAFLDWLQTTKTLQPEVNKNLADMIDKLTTIKALTPPAAAEIGKLLGPLKDGLEGMPGLFDSKLLTPAQSFNNDMLKMARENAGILVEIGKDIGSTIGGWFGSVLVGSMDLLNQLVARAKDGSSGIAKFFSSQTGQNVVGGVGLGMQTFGQGYQLGGLTSNRAVGTGIGAGTGAATGAMIGTFVMPGIGTAAGAGIGALAGAIGGWMGSNKKKKEEEAALKDLQAELLTTFKGMDKLREVAADVGIKIDKAFDMKDRKGAIKTIQAFTEALEKKNERLEAVGLAQAIVTEKTALFADGLKDATAVTEQNQAAFDRLGRQFVATFQAGIRETGDFFGTMQQLGPGLDQLSALQEKLGFHSSDTLTRLLGFRDVVNTNADVGQSIAMNTSLMGAYKAAGMLTRDTLLDFAADAIENYTKLRDRNVDANTAMILQQKELQGLWEAQKKYGSITDEATLSLLRQAEAAGVVGEQNRDVNDRMLETLIGIKTAVQELADVFSNELPEAARAGAEALDDAFRDRKYRIPVDFEFPDGYQPPSQPNPNGYAIGGTVPFTPGGRVVRVAEAGTEHIMSTEQVAAIAARIFAAAGGMGGGPSTVVVQNQIGSRQLNDVVVDVTNQALRNGRVRVPARQVHQQVF
jgi:hypothetical protein